METPQPAREQAAPLRVLLAEDSALIRERLGEVLAGCGADMVGHAAHVAAATRQILQSRPDLVILDIQLADGTGFDVLRAVHDQAPEIEILMFSNFSADPYRQLAGRFGVRGFFDKSREFDSLRDAIAQRVATRH
jgi:DNA-binding NarL/FixJ family response regulator